MFDSDATGVSTTTQDSKIIYNGSIDCSAYSSISITFESYYRRFHGNPYVEISVDNGSTWNQFQVHADINVNSSSANPTMVTVNISSVAANQANVKLRFRYIGEWDYAWMIDDIKIFVAPDYDVSMVQGRINFWAQYINYGYSGFYGQIPAFLMYEVGAPIWFTGVVKNYGSQVVTPIFTATVKDRDMNELYTESVTFENPLTTEAFDTITTTHPANGDVFYMDPTSEQDYLKFNWELSASIDGNQDENMSNNMISYKTYLTPATYAHDNDHLTGSWSTVNYQDGGIDGDIVGVLYDFYKPTSVDHVEFWVSSMTQVGTAYRVMLMTDPEDDGSYEEVTSSPTIYIDDESQVGTMHSVSFSDPYTIDVETGYKANVLVAIEMYFSGMQFRIGVDATAPTSGWETKLFFAGSGQWYYYGGDFVPILRLICGDYVGKNNISAENINIYPNPTNNIVNIANVEGANIQIVDITGKVLVNMNATQNNVSIDMSSFAQGTYIARITNNDGLTVKKINLIK